VAVSSRGSDRNFVFIIQQQIEQQGVSPRQWPTVDTSGPIAMIAFLPSGMTPEQARLILDNAKFADKQVSAEVKQLAAELCKHFELDRVMLYWGNLFDGGNENPLEEPDHLIGQPSS
jgi:hypothetical protein